MRTIIPQSLLQCYDEVPSSASSKAAIGRGHHSAKRKSFSKCSSVSIAALASVFIACYVLSNSSIVDSEELLQQAFRFIPSPSSVDRILANSAVVDSLRNEHLLGTPHPSTFLLGVFSMDSEKEAERRNLIRETMLGRDDDRVCSLKQYMDFITKNGYAAKQDCISPYAFIISAGGDDRPTEHGDDEPIVIDPSTIPNAEPDCIYLNIKENMENGKSVTYFKFGQSISDQFQIDYIGKTDSDSLIDMPTYLNFLMADLPPLPYNRRVYGGASWGNDKLSSFYAAGQFYFMSTDLAKYVSVTMSQKTYGTNKCATI